MFQSGIKKEWLKDELSLGVALVCLQEMRHCDVPRLRDLALTLQGPRTRGSLTKIGLDNIPDSLVLEALNVDATVRVEGHCYYLGHTGYLTNNLDGLLGAQAFNSIYTKWDVKLRQGAHGPELYRDTKADQDAMIPTNFFTVILGPDQDADPETVVVKTWHPGIALGMLPTHIYPDTDRLYFGTDEKNLITAVNIESPIIRAALWEWIAKHPYTAVKSHNGL